VLAQRLAGHIGQTLNSPLAISTSIGVATTHGEQEVDLLAEADRSLYEGKRRPDNHRRTLAPQNNADV